jgi:hypothetical protein
VATSYGLASHPPLQATRGAPASPEQREATTDWWGAINQAWEVDMSGNDDDFFKGDEGEAVSEFERLIDLLFQHVSEFADDQEVPDELLPLLLLQLSMTTRMMAYTTSVAKPSASGLKLDLDRFRRDAEDLIREMKKEAERFVAQAKEAIAASDLEDDGT